jgi:uncharacterized protein
VKSRRYSLPALAGLLFCALAAGALAQAGTGAEAPIPASPQRWLTDEAGFLSSSAAAEFDARLEEYERSSGHQFLVYIGRSTGITPIEDWAVRAFAAWKVGRRGLDDGLVLFLMAEDRRVRIEVGYGLEGKMPDALAGRIINEEMVPRLQNGDNDGAVRAAIDRLTAVIAGEGAAGGGEERTGSGRPLTLFEKVLIGIGILFFIILFITNPSLALYLLFTILSGGRGGGRGGFSGGGGRSGGGGASGSW